MQRKASTAACAPARTGFAPAIRSSVTPKPGAPYRTVHLVDGGAFVLHPDDEAAYVPDREDRGFYAIGMDCARVLGIDWTHSPTSKPSHKQ